MNSIYKAAASLILAAYAFQREAAGAISPFQIAATTSKSEFIRGEPVAVEFTISYNGTEPLTVDHPFDHKGYEELIEAGSETDRVFYRFVSPPEAVDALKERGPLPKIHFAPGAVLRRSHFLSCWSRGFAPEGKSEQIFPVAGKYVVRLTVRFDRTDASAEAIVTVIEPSRAGDMEARDWLNSAGLLCQLAYLPYDPKRVPQAIKTFQGLQDRFSNSVFAQFVRALPLTNVVATDSNRVPTTQMGRVIEELEAQWYDVRGFGRYHPEGNRAYLDVLLPLHESFGVGKLSQDEFDLRRAELFKQYVTNYSRPLSPEEWRRRYDAYNRESADRARQQQLDLQQYTIEADRILRDKPK